MDKVFRVSRSGFYYWVENRHKVCSEKTAKRGDNRNVKKHCCLL